MKKNNVISQSPKSKSIDEGSTISLVVSKGKESDSDDDKSKEDDSEDSSAKGIKITMNLLKYLILVKRKKPKSRSLYSR